MKRCAMKNVMFTALVVLIVGLWLCPPAWAEIESSAVDGIAASSYHKRKATLDKANEAAEAKGLTLEALGKACGVVHIRIGAQLSGQAPVEKKSQECLEGQLGLTPGTLAPLLKPPARWTLDLFIVSMRRWTCMWGGVPVPIPSWRSRFWKMSPATNFRRFWKG